MWSGCLEDLHATHYGPWCRCDALSDDYVARSTEALSVVSESLGGGPATILQDHRLENAELHAARRKVRSLMSKPDFARVWEEMLWHLEQDGANWSSEHPIPTDTETKAVMRLVVEVMLTGVYSHSQFICFFYSPIIVTTRRTI